jgi:SAM-dependent methyltransferase
MLNPIKNLFRINEKEKLQDQFVFDKELNIRKRKYDSYKEYILHQSRKLNLQFSKIKEYDKIYENIVIDRYKGMFDFNNKTLLSLGGRLGGEVRAFSKLGALAIGIDIEPGEKNPHVLYGDFHNIQFSDGLFDYAFCNAIDHAYDINKFLSEVHRVLKPDGRFIVELAIVQPGKYEVVDTSNVDNILLLINKYYENISVSELNNIASFVNWSGKLLVLKKRINV